MSPAGRTLGRYRIAHEIARGGMGVVCHATDTTLGRDVALKLLPADLAEDAARRRRFVQEARAAAALEHPHIAVIHDAGEIDGQAYIAMELIRGTSLAVEIGQRPLPMARAIQLALQMASGLARAHEGHVVHRDLKPSNVMVTADGHAKIIDFGIAKVLDGVDAPEDSTRTRLTTSPGAVVGTTAYMSPEQVRGGTVDHRSDVFAFGVVLHEMVTGRIPFAGSTSLETATAILRDAAPRLDLAGTVPLGVTADLQRVIDKCLAKDADDRYQGMRDVAVDLRAISRQLDATPATAAPLAGVAGADAGGRASQPRRSWRHIWAAVGLGVAGAGIWLATALWTDPRSSSGASAALPATPEKPRVAVLYFDNTSADRELDWLRAGITEMVVTDLSQSTALEVVGTDRLYEVAARLQAADAPSWSPDIVRTVAAETGADTIVVGSFLRAGSALRITARLQEAASGRLISSERVDSVDTAGLFGLVDDLTRRLRTRLEGGPMAGPDRRLLPAPPGGPALDRGIGDVTTSSVAAYREYAEGMQLHERNREDEAAAQFARAVDLDPDFAMAYAKLAVVQGNLGRGDLRRKYAEMALARASHLTPVERAYIEGVLYAGSPATLERGLQAYERCVALNAAHLACRNNLADRLVALERYADAIPRLDELVRRGTSLPTVFGLLAQAHGALGKTDRAVALTEDYARTFPDVAAGHLNLARALIVAGRFADAIAVLDRAEQRSLRHPSFGPIRVAAAVHGGDTAAAERGAAALSASSSPVAKWYGALWQTHLAARAGRCGAALAAAGRAIAALDAPGFQRAFARQIAAGLHHACGQAAQAIVEAQRALADARGTELQASVTSTLAALLARQGRRDDAMAALATMPEAATPLSTAVRARERAFARGRVALALGDAPGAVSDLTAAAAALSPRSSEPAGVSDHVPIWFATGEALYLAGRPAEARPWFERIAAGPFETQGHPLEQVRSFDYLARIAAAAGDPATAANAYRRFLAYWRGGDIDRARVAEAERAAAALAPAAR